MPEKIFEVDYEPGESVTFRFHVPSMKAASEAKGHAQKAGREVLLSLRSLLDSAIEALDRDDEGDTGKRTKIEVE